SARNLEDAETYLTRAVKTQPHLHMRLATLYALRGDRQRAASEAELALSHYRLRAREDLQDQAARVRWADALAFLERVPEAVTVLEEGWNATREPLYRTALAAAYLAWADFLAHNPKTSVGERLRLVERGLAYDPDNPALLDRLVAATRTDGADGDAA